MKTNGSNALAEPAVPWYHNPERKCIGDIRMINLPTGPRSKIEIQSLIYRCYRCPVISECYEDALNAPKKYRTKDVIQGGELWR